jgi:hypothetical protein
MKLRLKTWITRAALGGVLLGALASTSWAQTLGEPQEPSGPVVGSEPPRLTTLPDSLPIGAAKGTPPAATNPVPTTTPAAPAAATDAAPCTDCGTGAFDWTKSKYRYQKFFWPIAYPTNTPTGPGYYSLLDVIQGKEREAPPKNGYPRIFATPYGFADADFSYVDQPGYQPTFLESLHRIHVGDDWMIGTGGEFRWRYDNEGNARLSGKRNNFDLTRTRIFGEVWYRDLFRVYAEMISAQTFNQSLPPALSDRDYADVLNLFVEFKTFTLFDENVYTRVGRQQLLLGSQRVITPSDWGNTMRTFDGVRMTRRSEKFDADLFWLRPVIPNANNANTSEAKENFFGAYTTYRPMKDQILDTYFLNYESRDNVVDAKAHGVPLPLTSPFNVSTLGFRYAGRVGDFLWDTENMLQFGNRDGHSISAGNTSAGIGWNFKDAPLNPTFWAYYDRASGSNSVGGSSTYNQLFPLSHYYLGWMDYVGRSNIQDINFHMYLYPTKWITVNTQFHMFNLVNAKDALYGVTDAVSRVDPTGKAGRDVGKELDFIVNWHLTRNIDVVTAYSHMFAGDFLRNTGSANNLNTAWLIFNVRW